MTSAEVLIGFVALNGETRAVQAMNLSVTTASLVPWKIPDRESSRVHKSSSDIAGFALTNGQQMLKCGTL